MDYITSKVFIIAVGILVTLMIVTGVIFVFTKMGEIYNITENTNTSILSQYDNIYSMYSGAELNTVGLLNTLRKYREDNEINIIININGTSMYADKDTKVSAIAIIEDYVANNQLGYEELFNVYVQENGVVIDIVFEKK